VKELTKNRFMTLLVAVAVLLAAVGVLLASCNNGEEATTTTAAGVTTSVAVAGGEKTLAAGEAWALTETTSLDSLTIGEGASITAPTGNSLTMTVDGVETPIKAGTYGPNVVLTLTTDVTEDWNGMGVTDTYYYRTALYVADGKVVPDKSVSAAVVGGTVSDTSAENVSITSVGDEFNGIWVTGSSVYSIVSPTIDFTGNGGNDFAGFGAAIKTDGTAQVTIEDANIVTSGVIRTAVWVSGNAVTHVNNSYIETHSGTFPADYTGGPFGGGGIMMEPPWMLGITGNCRATNCLGSGTVYYDNCEVVADSWGALSTDSCQDVHLNATNTKITVNDSGYGAYADQTSLDTFSACEFNVPDFGVIMTQGSVVFTDATVVNSDRFGVMSHSSAGTNTLTIEKGSVFNTGSACILFKSSNPSIVVDSAELNSENGIIFQAMVNDDPMAGAGGPPGAAPPGDAGAAPAAETTTTVAAAAAGGAPPAGGTPPPDSDGDGVPDLPPDGSPPPDGYAGGAAGATPPDTSVAAAGDAPAATTTTAPAAPAGTAATTAAKDISATFSNMSMTGDIVNTMTSLGNVNVSFKNATITGAITTATAAWVGTYPRTQENLADFSEVVNTYGETTDPYGVSVNLDATSKWIVDETSYLTSLTVAAGAEISAPAGYTLTMTLDGVETRISAATFNGKIVLTVTKS
jgi:hypothetical protein